MPISDVVDLSQHRVPGALTRIITLGATWSVVFLPDSVADRANGVISNLMLMTTDPHYNIATTPDTVAIGMRVTYDAPLGIYIGHYVLHTNSVREVYVGATRLM